MAKSFAQIARNRRTVYEFSDRPVSTKLVWRILDLARWAPSSHNDQNWHFVIVANPKTINEIFDHCVYGSFYSVPPVVVAVVAEPIYDKKPGLKSTGVVSLNEYHRYINVGFVASQIVNGAEALGLGSCIVTPTDQRANALLRVVSPAHVAVVIGLGYPKRLSFKRKRERKPLEQLVSYEKR